MSENRKTSTRRLRRGWLLLLTAGLLAGGWPTGLGAQDISLAIGELPPGETVTITFRATVDNPVPAGTDQVSNQGQVSGTNFAPLLTDDPDDPNSSSDPTVTPIDAAPALAAVKSVSDAVSGNNDGTAQPGEVLTYEITVTNTGNEGAAALTISDLAPADTTYDDGSGAITGSAGVTGALITNNVGGLTVTAVELAGGGGFITVQFTVTVIASPVGTTISNTAQVQATGIPAFDSTQADIDIEAADLTITKADDVDPVLAGGTLIYTVEVANAGPSDAEDVVVTDTLPAGVTTVETTGCTEDPNGVPTCTLGTIIAGGSASFTIEVTVEPFTVGTITNEASVTSSTTLINTGDDTVSENTQVDVVLTGWDSDDFLVADPGGERIVVYDFDLSFKGFLEVAFPGVTGLDFNGLANLVAVSGEDGAEAVREYSPAPATVSSFSHPNLGDAFELKSIGGLLYVATEDGGLALQEFSPAGAPLRTLGSDPYGGVEGVPGDLLWAGLSGGIQIDVFDIPSGLAQAPIPYDGGQVSAVSLRFSALTGTVLVADAGSDAVFERDTASGALVRTFTAAGFEMPLGVARGPGGDVFATTCNGSGEAFYWLADGTFVGATPLDGVTACQANIVWAGSLDSDGDGVPDDQDLDPFDPEVTGDCTDIRALAARVRATPVGEFVFSSYRVIMGYMAGAAARNCDIDDWRDVVTLLNRIHQRVDGQPRPGDWMNPGMPKDDIASLSQRLRDAYATLLP